MHRMLTVKMTACKLPNVSFSSAEVRFKIKIFFSARGAKLREEKEKERALLEEGHKIYQSYCNEGQEFKKNQEEKLQTLGNEVEELQKQWDELNQAKEEREIPEKAAKAKHEAVSSAELTQ